MPNGYFKLNTIYCGDCEGVLAKFPDDAVDLIYVDPPFFSNKHYEVLWGDGYELRAFEDRWKGGIENYILWMEGKLRECHRVLKNTGSMYLHCDWHANAHLRILMDNIFGEKNFRNEIIWHYSGWNRKLKNSFSKRHDNILFYGKSNKQSFNSYALEWENKEEYVRIRKQKIMIDGDGREYVKSDAGGGKRVKRYLEDAIKDGKPIDDVWDLDKINNSSKEFLGYPTQKPEDLLKQIIIASSNKNDVILDPMCGCGTAIAAAHELNRNWIGIDVSPTACKLMVGRMRKMGVDIGENKITDLPRTLEKIKKIPPFEFQNWVCQKLLARASRKKTGDMGVDGWLLDGRPLQVKQSENIGRNVIDNFETAIRRAKKKKGVFVAFSFGKGAYEEVARARLHDDLEIELKTVEEIIDG